MATVTIQAAALEGFAAALLEATDAPDAAARTAAEHLVAADLAGHGSHGLRLLPHYAEACRSGVLDPAAVPVIERDRGSIVSLDGNRALGQVAATAAVDLAVERARVHGVAVVTMRGSGHIGRLAEYVERAAEAGVIALLATNDSGCNQVVAPHGSDEGRLATNPIAVGVPRQTRPHLVLDMATSVVSHGTVELARRNHAAVPSEWTGSSPDVLRPLGGPKGTGLALLVDVLAGILSGAGFSGSEAEHDYQGVWLLALDPAWFEGGQDLAADVDVLVAHVRSARPDGSGGYGDVLVPGEPGARATRANLDRGVPIDEHVWADVLELAESLGVPPITPFEEAEP